MRIGRPTSSLPSPLALTLRLSPALARLIMLAAAAVVTLAVALLFREQTAVLEERVGAEAWKLGGAQAPEERLTLITIDEESLAEVGPWPWPRETMAELAGQLEAAGAQTQLYDIVFPEAKPGDEPFISALQSGNAVLAQAPVLGARQNIQAGSMTHAMGGVSCGASGAPATPNYLANHSGFSALPKGHITPRVDSDGGIRQIPAYICVDGEAYPTLAISGLLTAAGAENSQGGWDASLRPGESLLDPTAFLELEGYPGLSIPLDGEANMRISFDRPPETFRAVSAADVLGGEIEPGMLENTWALVGATAFGMGDVVPTPYSGAAPGLELQARLVTSLLDNEMPYTPRGATWIMLALSAAAGAVLVLLASFRHRLAMFGLPAAGLLLPAGALALHAWLLSSAGLWLGWFAPALFAVTAAGLLLLLEHSRVRLEHERLYGNLNSYLPADIAREVAYSLPSSDVDARRVDVTLLSADLRNFSAYTEARPPEESAVLLHYFFVLATEIVERHEGRVHEFKGDGLLAVWSGDGQGARQALQAAEAMQVAIQRDMLPRTPPNGLEPLGLGIGIEQGSALMGSIGPARRRSHALLGDTVAIALRIQEMTAELALPILVGEHAAARIGGPEGETLQSQGRYLLSGLKVPHTLYSPAIPEGDRPEQPGTETPALKVVTGGRQG